VNFTSEGIIADDVSFATEMITVLLSSSLIKDEELDWEEGWLWFETISRGRDIDDELESEILQGEEDDDDEEDEEEKEDREEMELEEILEYKIKGGALQRIAPDSCQRIFCANCFPKKTWMFFSFLKWFPNTIHRHPGGPSIGIISVTWGFCSIWAAKWIGEWKHWKKERNITFSI